MKTEQRNNRPSFVVEIDGAELAVRMCEASYNLTRPCVSADVALTAMDEDCREGWMRAAAAALDYFAECAQKGQNPMSAKHERTGTWERPDNSDRDALILAYYQAGNSVRKTAHTFNVSGAAISKILKKLGAETRSNSEGSRLRYDKLREAGKPIVTRPKGARAGGAK